MKDKIKSLISVLVVIFCSCLTNDSNQEEQNSFESYGLISHSIPHFAPKINFSDNLAKCITYTQHDTNPERFDIWFRTDFVTPYGACDLGEISNQFKDSCLNQIEMNCDSLEMLHAVMTKFKISEGNFSDSIIPEKNHAYLLKTGTGKRVLIAFVGQYLGGYVRRQIFWGILKSERD